jgi:hypothetical protein
MGDVAVLNDTEEKQVMYSENMKHFARAMLAFGIIAAAVQT